MKTIINVILNLFFFFIVFSVATAQSTADLSKLAPKQATNLKNFAAPTLSATVHVAITGDIQETQACQPQSLAYGGLKVELNWYNNNDETGKMMLGMVSNKPDIEKHWVSHKNQVDEIYQHYSTKGNSLACSLVSEEDVPGGKLYIIDYSYANCDTDKARQRSVVAKCFFFNGTSTGNIEISCQCTPDEVRNMVKSIIKSTLDFDFSGLL
jgi:hypothetical protein